MIHHQVPVGWLVALPRTGWLPLELGKYDPLEIWLGLAYQFLVFIWIVCKLSLHCWAWLLSQRGCTQLTLQIVPSWLLQSPCDWFNRPLLSCDRSSNWAVWIAIICFNFIIASPLTRFHGPIFVKRCISQPRCSDLQSIKLTGPWKELFPKWHIRRISLSRCCCVKRSFRLNSSRFFVGASRHFESGYRITCEMWTYIDNWKSFVLVWCTP